MGREAVNSKRTHIRAHTTQIYKYAVKDSSSIYNIEVCALEKHSAATQQQGWKMKKSYRNRFRINSSGGQQH
jgi:hypothetical protein